jgi:hypothetical protein
LAIAGRHIQLRYLVVVLLTAALLLGILIALPVSLQSIVRDLSGDSQGAVLNARISTGATAESSVTSLHVAFASLDELHQLLTLRVSGNHECPSGCTWTDRVIFFSIRTDEADIAGMPPSASVDLPPSQLLVTRTIELPIRGQPALYPFDEYTLWLGISLVRVLPDGSEVPYTRDDAPAGLQLTFQEQLPRQHMMPPVSIDVASVQQPDDLYQYLVVESLTFVRPVYMRILAVLLLLLIAAAAAYAVFMRPLHDLVLNAGALVLGVWGIRAIITPGNFNHLTAMDLALSVVILFLLSALTFRALQFAHHRSGLASPTPDASADAAVQGGGKCDDPDCDNGIATRCTRCRGVFCPRHISGGPDPICDVCDENSRQPSHLAGRTTAPGQPADS